MPSLLPFGVLQKEALGADNSNIPSDPSGKSFYNNFLVVVRQDLPKDHDGFWMKEPQSTNLINRGADSSFKCIQDSQELTGVFCCKYLTEDFGFWGRNLHFKLQE